jgi:RES domain-containing protein
VAHSRQTDRLSGGSSGERVIGDAGPYGSRSSSSHVSLRVTAPEIIAIEAVGTDTLTADWKNQLAATRDIGDQWLDRSSSALFQVPSVIVPRARNFLLNPAHTDAVGFRVAEVIEAPFDRRLF